MKTLIRFENVSKCFGEQTVLDELSLDIHEGRITFILGKSGTGKSVLIKHIIGLLRPDSGSIFIDDEDITQLDEPAMNKLRMQFGMLFQDAALFDSMTAFENVAFPLVEHRKLSQKEIREIVEAKLTLVGLMNVEGKFPSELSGGMRKRVGLARAIVLDPRIILYDEPTTGLDPLRVEQINELIVNTQKAQEATSIVISHDIPTAMQIADDIAVINEGRIVAFGSPEEIKASENPFVQKFLNVGGVTPTRG